ncbi:MAG: anthranilate synthase component I, partial [Zymomonas sp.]
MTLEILSDGAERYHTLGGVAVTRRREVVPYAGAIEPFVDRLDTRRGAVFSSNYEYPGRYTRWDTAIVDPPLMVTSAGRQMAIEALNPRGEALLGFVAGALAGHEDIAEQTVSADRIDLRVKLPDRAFTEEERSRMPAVFSVLRSIVGLFKSEENA